MCKYIRFGRLVELFCSPFFFTDSRWLLTCWFNSNSVWLAPPRSLLLRYTTTVDSRPISCSFQKLNGRNFSFVTICGLITIIDQIWRLFRLIETRFLFIFNRSLIFSLLLNALVFPLSILLLLVQSERPFFNSVVENILKLFIGLFARNGSIDWNGHFNSKERILETFWRRWSFLWIILQHVCDELHGRLGRILYDYLQRLGHKLGEFVTQLAGKFKSIGPILASWSSQNFTNLSHLVLLGLAREKWSHRKKLCHNAPHCKNIDRGVVIWRSQ